jgi:imidazolonepropionase-like amidohydrolase
MKSSRLELLGSLLLVSVSSCASAPEPSPAAPHPSAAPSPAAPPPVDASCTLISNVRLFDGERVTEKTSVLFRDGKIAEVSPTPAARCANTVDGAGKTLLPGLIDAHTHAHSEADLASALRYGVTTELDMFGAPKAKAKLRAYAHEHADVSDFFSAGAGITSPGGHGTEYGIKVRTVDGPNDAEPFVEECVKEGSDYIKIIYTPDSKRFRSISRETLKASVEAAHRHHLLAVVHIDTLHAGQDAIEAGADALVHLFWDTAASPAFVEVAKSHKAFIVPTLSVLSTLSGNPHGPKLAGDGTFASRLDAQNLKTLRQKIPGALPTDENGIRESVRLLHAAGVPLLAGTDAANAGTAHGASMHGELELLVAAGLTPVDALIAATATPAQSFALKDRGRIAPGLRADLLLVEGDPTHDILATRRIAGVWRGGAELKAMDAPPAEPEPVVVAPKREPGLISDFEATVGGARFGIGWKESSDSIANGHSTVTLDRKKGGAHGKWSLDVKGEIVAGASVPWGGVMLHPGDEPFGPANLSAAKELVFAARGAGQTVRVMLFTVHGGRMPAIKAVSLTKTWMEHRIPFADFQGADGSDVIGIAFVAGPSLGKYEFQLDDVAIR